MAINFQVDFYQKIKNLFLLVQSVQGNVETIKGNVKNPLQHLVESNMKNLLKEHTAGRIWKIKIYARFSLINNSFWNV